MSNLCRTVCTLCTVIICAMMVEGQRSHLLQDVIQRIKSYPRHKRISTSWKGERKFEVIGRGRLPMQGKNHLRKKSDDEEEISDNLNHKPDDQKRYPGKTPHISDGQVGNAPAIMPQGVKMVQGDHEQNHQPSAAIFKQKNTAIKNKPKSPLVRNRVNNLKYRKPFNDLARPTRKFPQLSLNLLNMFKLNPRLFPGKAVRRKISPPVQSKQRRVIEAVQAEEKRPPAGFSPPDTIDTGFTPYFKGSKPWDEKEYLANITTPTTTEQATKQDTTEHENLKYEKEETQPMPKKKYGGKIQKYPEFKPRFKKPYGSLRRQPEGALSDSYSNDRNFASNKGQISVVPDISSNPRNSELRSKPKTTQLPSVLMNSFQSGFNDFDFDTDISSFSLFSPKTITSPVPKQPKRQKSGYYIKEKPLVTESQRRTLDEQNFDTWDKENTLKYQTEAHSPGSSNFRISELRNSNFRSKPKNNTKASKSSSYSKSKFNSNVDDFNFNAGIPSFSAFSEKPLPNFKPETKQPKRQQNRYYSTNNAQADEPERRSWDENSFDGWDRQKSRSEKTTSSSYNPQKNALEPSPPGFNFDLSKPSFPAEFSKFKMNQDGQDQLNKPINTANPTKNRDYSLHNQKKDIEYDQSNFNDGRSISRRKDVGFYSNLPGSGFLLAQQNPTRVKKESKNRKDESKNPLLNFQLSETSFSDKADIDHFFTDVEDTFPSVGSFGESWESAKLRRRRDTQNHFFFPEEPIFKRSIGEPTTIGPDQRKNKNDASDPSGFWGGADFETDFFNLLNGETHEPYLSLLHAHKYGIQGDKTGGKHQKKGGAEKLQSSATTYPESVQTNEILGSGDFELVRGGTYFERDAHLHNLHRYNPPPEGHSYSRGYFHNFRDFADIKEDKSKTAHFHY